MWFFFGIFTLTAATIWGLKTRLGAKWSGSLERLGRHSFDIQEVRHKGRIRLVRLGTQAPAGFHFRVRRERAHDRFFKWLGVCTEIQTDKAGFDRTLYVESDARATGILLKRDAELRFALLKIFTVAKAMRLQRMRVRCAERRVWLEFRPKNEDDLFAAKNELVPAVQAISSGLGSIDLPSEYKRDRFVWRAAAVLAFSTATFILGFAGLTRSIVGRTDILEPTLLFAACLIPAVLLVIGGITFILAWLVGSSRAHIVLLEFAVVGGIGLIMSTYALAREANMDFDFEPSTRYELTNIQTEHRTTRGRRGRKHQHYYLYCPDWRNGHEGRRLRLEISSSTFYEMKDSRSAAIYIRPGLLGFDWVEKIEPAW
jgi:hypothetical protein